MPGFFTLLSNPYRFVVHAANQFFYYNPTHTELSRFATETNMLSVFVKCCQDLRPKKSVRVRI